MQARLYPQHHTHTCLSRCEPPPSCQAPVLKITKVVADGLHSPLTMRGGWPVVNGVATSYNSPAVVARNKYLVPLVEAVCPSLGRLVVAFANPKTMHYIDGQVPCASNPSSLPLLLALSDSLSVSLAPARWSSLSPRSLRPP